MRQPNETRLELRARKLGDAISRRVDIVSTSLRPQGQRPSFTTMLSKNDALNWWMKNYSNPMTGGRVLQQMDPMSQMELHAALSQHIEQQMGGQSMMPPGTTATPAMQSGGLDAASMGAAQTLSAPSMSPGAGGGF